MSLETMLTLAVAIMVFVASPGPGIFALIGRAMTAGFASAMALSVGMILGDMVWMTLAICGLSVLAQTMGEFFIVLKIVGGLFLAWMGVKAWLAAPQPMDTVVVSDAGGLLRTALAGLGVTMSNPKSMLFYAAFLPNFIDLSTFSPIELTEAVGIIWFCSLSVCLAYAGAATRARLAFRSIRAIKVFNRVSGTLLVGAGVAVATR